MAIIRATKSSGGGGNKFMGFCEMSWLDVKDRINEKTDSGDIKFPWADIYLDVQLKARDSEYTRNMQICGSLDKDSGGKVKPDNSLLKRIYWFFDAIGCQAGVNAHGEWEDEKGNKIENISDYLKEFIPNNETFNLYAYIYKEQDKKDPMKAWTRVHNHVVSNTESTRKELEGYIAFVKSKGYLKEAVENSLPSDVITVNTDDELSSLLSGMPE